MEAILIYFAKSSVLIALFYLSYYFLIQKETFFNSNRWFLLLGLIISALLPLYFIKKTIVTEASKIVFNVAPKLLSPQNHSIENVINWFEITAIIYKLGFIIFLFKIGLEIFSFFKLIKKKPIVVVKPFIFIDVSEDINPFSFLKYIVYNSSKYSEQELSSIICHEKIHANENHSFDILFVRLFCVCFWFNPFIWLYKKAIIQNLEYVADRKAIQNVADKKTYQMTLLKVITNYNYLPITNSFYQSLIKKRIVMLNKKQSEQKSIWKYALILPALIVFVLLFQVKTIAQEKPVSNALESQNTKDFEIIIDKNSSDDKIKLACKLAKEQENIDVVVFKIKRNSKNEITAINISLNDNKGNKSYHNIKGDEPISLIKIKRILDENQKEYFGIYNAGVIDATNESQTILKENTSLKNPIPPTPPNAPNITPPTPPTAPQLKVTVPKNINDKKAWKKYELAMDSYDKEMELFDKKMEAYDKVMESFDAEMEIFHKEMLVFDKKMEAYNNEINKPKLKK
jgi:BlaR1 peptidase M56